MGWVGIGIFAGTLLTGFIGWVMRRIIFQRVDLLEAAVFGDTGVRERLHKYVTTEAFEARLSTFSENIRGLREEGQHREGRILAAIENQTLVIGSEVREIKQDLRAQAARIDDVIKSRGRS